MKKIEKGTDKFFVFKYLGLALAIFVLAYLFINAPAIISKINFWLGGKFGNDQNEILITESGEIPNVKDRKILSNDTLYIPRLHISAKVSWNVEKSDESTKLKDSVIQLADTALPGKVGNVFITGHSSYYWWLGKYTNIFANLNKLEKNDRIAIVKDDTVFIYKIRDIFVVKPDNLNVLAQGTKKELTLMTCVPIGTNLNRLIIKADQIRSTGR